jgi:phosphoribosylformylglycinamidine cyclo-ligase
MASCIAAAARNDGLHVIKDNLFEVPPLFRLIKEQSGTSLMEMYKVFNMGHRMEIYTDEQTAGQIISISESFNVQAQIVGRVESSEGKKVSVHTAEGVFEYS